MNNPRGYTFRPPEREDIPCCIGLAGPSKSGKTYSAFRLAKGMANGGTIAMINTEGPKGHMYLEIFKPYVAAEIRGPSYSPEEYHLAIEALKDINPAVVIIDSMSHCHEGPGGLLEWHEKELDRMAGNDFAKRDKMTFAAWVKPKQAETIMINALGQLRCHAVLCFRAKEKLEIKTGQKPKDMGWQPICSDRIPYETTAMFILPAHCKGVPDLSALGSEIRETIPLPPDGKPFDEAYGKTLAEWSNKVNKKEPPAFITHEQGAEINMAMKSAALLPQALFTHFNIKRLGELRADQVAEVEKWIASANSVKPVDESPGEVAEDNIPTCGICGGSHIDADHDVRL